MKVRPTLFALSMFLLLAAAPVPAAKVQPQPMAGWTYQGCFSLNGTTPCSDVYTHNGGYWMCSSCGTTKQPSENKCRQLSAYQLTNGRWCS